MLLSGKLDLAMKLYVNGAMVTKADINAKNGLIHVIDNVLMPATGNDHLRKFNNNP